jgi:hypothetical protein
MNEIRTRYTMSLARKNDDLYGPIHGGNYYTMTACNRETNEDWIITTNDWTGKITCKKCLKVLKNG